MLLKVWFKYLQIYSFWEVNVNLLVHVFDAWGWVFFRSSFWEARCCLGKQWRSWYPFCWKYLSVNYKNSVQRTKGEMSRHVLCIQVKFLRKNETDSICLTGAVSWRNVYSNCCKHKGVFPLKTTDYTELPTGNRHTYKGHWAQYKLSFLGILSPKNWQN